MTVFLLVVMTTLLTYSVLSKRLDRRATAVAVERLAPRKPQNVDTGRRAAALFLESGTQLRGLMARRLLERLRLDQAAARLLETAALKWGPAGLLHRSIAFFIVGFGIATIAMGNTMPLVALGAGAAVSLLPFWYVRRKARVRVQRFEEQFPESLEFISRSMRAGHAFSVALEMIHKEFSEPLAAEFRKAYEEQNLGQPLELVMRKLSERIPSMDVQFFVSAVLLQKRTGGNLAELLDKLAQLIRERFKLRARIRAISAQGLMSGRILGAIPVGVALLMFVVNPQYARFFIDDPMGHQLIGMAFGLQFVGYLIIRKIVTFDI